MNLVNYDIEVEKYNLGEGTSYFSTCCKADVAVESDEDGTAPVCSKCGNELRTDQIDEA